MGRLAVDGRRATPGAAATVASRAPRPPPLRPAHLLGPGLGSCSCVRSIGQDTLALYPQPT